MNRVDIEIQKRENLAHIGELEAAENRKDVDKILELVTEDFVFMYRDARFEGIEDLGKMLKESVNSFVSSKHVPMRVEVSSSGDMTWLVGYELIEHESDNVVVETKQNYLLTFRMVDGAWKEVAVCIA